MRVATRRLGRRAMLHRRPRRRGPRGRPRLGGRRRWGPGRSACRRARHSGCARWARAKGSPWAGNDQAAGRRPGGRPHLGGGRGTRLPRSRLKVSSPIVWTADDLEAQWVERPGAYQEGSSSGSGFERDERSWVSVRWRSPRRRGCTFTNVSSVERGERNISLENILRLAAGLGVDPGDLVEGLPADRS